MKIFIPFKIKGTGGVITFACKFKKGMRKSGHEVFFEFKKNYDVLFLIGQSPFRYLLHAKLKKKRIIQRLDGVFSKASGWGKFYWIYNLKMKIVYNYLADSIIYQSNFSKMSCEKLLGKPNTRKTTILYNGIDTNKIKPDINTTPSGNIKLLTFANFRRRDQIEPIIKSVKLLDSEKFSLDIFGSYTKNLQNIFNSLPCNIRFRGEKKNEELLNVINQYAIFLFSDQSACPNSVMEALAAGLPVVAYDRGSIDELVDSEYNGEVIKLSPHDCLENNYPFDKKDYQEFSEKIIKISNNLPLYKNNARKSAERKFNLDIMLSKYTDILSL